MRSGERRVQSDAWDTQPAKPPRSVFDNYCSEAPQDRAGCPQPAGDVQKLQKTFQNDEHIAPYQVDSSLQGRIDEAIARSFLYRLLALAYEDPTAAGWTRMTESSCQSNLEAAIHTLAVNSPTLAGVAGAFLCALKPEGFDDFVNSYLIAFGHAARGQCPLNEIDYGDMKADPLFQPHRLADLCAFYRAFGLEVADNAGERPDHICLELEFMCVLAAKEAYTLEHQLDLEDLSVCREAQKRFLREHLARWVPGFTRRVARLVGNSVLGALANLTCAFVEADCARFTVAPGGQELLLRPVNEAADSMCASCGASQLHPEGWGASATE